MQWIKSGVEMTDMLGDENEQLRETKEVNRKGIVKIQVD